MKGPTPRRPHNPVVPILLLALLCVGGMELLFCAHFSPALYHRITDPIVEPVVRAAHAVKAELDRMEFELRLDRTLSEISELSARYKQPRPAPLPERPQYVMHPELLEPPELPEPPVEAPALPPVIRYRHDLQLYRAGTVAGEQVYRQM